MARAMCSAWYPRLRIRYLWSIEWAPRRRGDPVTSSVGRRPLLPRPAAGEAVEAMPRAAVDEPANRAEDRPFDRQRGEKERPAYLAMLGLGGLLVGDEPPDGVEELLRDRAGEDAAEDAEGEEEDLHDRVRPLGRPLLLWLAPRLELDLPLGPRDALGELGPALALGV